MKFTSVGLVALVFTAALSSETGCSINPCGAGYQECSDGTCAPEGNVCCGNGTSCPGGYVCGVGDTCLSSAPPQVTSCESCLASGQECCLNDDGTVDCASVGRVCCGNHTNCPAGTYCINGGAACE